MAESARQVIHSLNPTLPVSNVKTMETIVSDSVAASRFNMSLFGLFAVIAMGLTIAGVSGVMNYAVSHRTQEIGIRMALGARPAQARAMVLKQGLALAAAGLIAGLAGSFAVTRWLGSLLYNTRASDPGILVSAALLLVAVALVTCYLPAQRATRVDPIEALRHE